MVHIEDTEKKYMGLIWKIVSSDRFLNDLKNIEKYIQKNYDYLASHWDEKNKLKIGVERLIRYHFYTDLNVVNVYPSPISPDMAIEVEDAILCIDAKTIDMVGNPGDDRSIHFQKNQITFNNRPLYEQIVNNINLPGVTFPSRLKPFHNEKPCLTYFITINYYDDGSSFRLSHFSVLNVPHHDVAEQRFDNTLISNYKTYQYMDKVKARTYGSEYLPQEKIKDHWFNFSMKGSGKKDSFLDLELRHPISDIDSHCVWKKQDKKYKIVNYGGSARINKDKLEPRWDSNGDKWVGVKTKKIKD